MIMADVSVSRAQRPNDCGLVLLATVLGLLRLRDPSASERADIRMVNPLTLWSKTMAYAMQKKNRWTGQHRRPELANKERSRYSQPQYPCRIRRPFNATSSTMPTSTMSNKGSPVRIPSITAPHAQLFKLHAPETIGFHMLPYC